MFVFNDFLKFFIVIVLSECKVVVYFIGKVIIFRFIMVY